MFGFRSMMYGGGYGYDDFGVDRSSWSDKSDAALRRERQADGLFDAFLKECGTLDATDKSAFPVTKEVIGADCHLTGACYTSFRKRVMDKGCKVKRREATPAERSASGDTRRGKLYVISIVCPVHPTKAADAKAKAELAAAARKKKAAEAAQRKAEKEQKEREDRERLAKLQREKVRERYLSIVGEGKDDELKHKQPSPDVKKSSTSTLDTFVNVNVTSEALLQHAKSEHDKSTYEISNSIREEERQLMTELRKKHAKEEDELLSKMRLKQSGLIDNANTKYDEIKAKIEKECKKSKVVSPSDK